MEKYTAPFSDERFARWCRFCKLTTTTIAGITITTRTPVEPTSTRLLPTSPYRFSFASPENSFAHRYYRGRSVAAGAGSWEGVITSLCQRPYSFSNKVSGKRRELRTGLGPLLQLWFRWFSFSHQLLPIQNTWLDPYQNHFLALIRFKRPGEHSGELLLRSIPNSCVS